MQQSKLQTGQSTEYTTKCILVVDDEKDIREMIVFTLHRAGFEVLAAANAEQMWNQLRQVIPDLLVLDVMMPGKNGYQICHDLRSQEVSRDIPIIVMTAHDEAIYARISADVGALHHLTKPFHPLELIVCCHRVLMAANPSQIQIQVKGR